MRLVTIGVVRGVADVVRNPIKGAKKDGLSGFAKGVGTGLIGVVVKPVDGAVGLASDTFAGIANVAEGGGGAVQPRKQREARYIPASG